METTQELRNSVEVTESITPAEYEARKTVASIATIDKGYDSSRGNRDLYFPYMN